MALVALEEAAGGLLGGLRRAALLRRLARGRPHEVRPSRELEMVNSLHSRLKAFIGRFNGVSNRRLQRYLDWFCWREQFRRSARGRRELLFAHEASYLRCTRELTHLESHPFLSLGQPRQHRGEVRLYVNGGLTAGRAKCAKRGTS